MREPRRVVNRIFERHVGSSRGAGSWGQLARHLEDVHLQSGGDPQTKILHKFGAGNDEQTLVNHGMAMRVGVAAPLRTLRHVVSANPGGFSSGTCMPARQRHPLSFLVAASSPRSSEAGHGWGVLNPRQACIWGAAHGPRLGVESMCPNHLGRAHGWARGLYYAPPEEKMPDDDEDGTETDDTFERWASPDLNRPRRHCIRQSPSDDCHGLTFSKGGTVELNGSFHPRSAGLTDPESEQGRFASVAAGDRGRRHRPLAHSAHVSQSNPLHVPLGLSRCCNSWQLLRLTPF